MTDLEIRDRSLRAAETILRWLEQKGYTDTDWWSEAESLPVDERPVEVVAREIAKAIKGEA